MLTVQNIALISDLVRLPKDILRDVCTNINLPSEGTMEELAERIWSRISRDRHLQDDALEACKGRLFGGKTAICWYALDTDGELNGLKDLIVENLGYNPFEQQNFPHNDDITTTPILISGAPGDTEREYYLRFIHKTGVVRNFYGTEMTLRPKTSITTMYVNESTKCLEIRSDPKTADKVAKSFAALINQTIALGQQDIMAPFGHSAEKIADTLGGELFDADAKPEYILANFSEEHAQAVVQILGTLDNYFADDNVAVLQEGLEQAKENFGAEHLAVPFTALILNGLDKIGMGVNGRDLRGLPLYDFLKPYLQPQGGHIKFPMNDDGVTTEHTIRVGLKTNSIVFATPATESVIGYVRERLVNI